MCDPAVRCRGHPEFLWLTRVGLVGGDTTTVTFTNRSSRGSYVSARRRGTGIAAGNGVQVPALLSATGRSQSGECIDAGAAGGERGRFGREVRGVGVWVRHVPRRRHGLRRDVDRLRPGGSLRSAVSVPRVCERGARCSLDHDRDLHEPGDVRLTRGVAAAPSLEQNPGEVDVDLTEDDLAPIAAELPEAGGRDFERLCKWLLEKVSPRVPGATGAGLALGRVARGRGSSRDLGIDLVAERVGMVAFGRSRPSTMTPPTRSRKPISTPSSRSSCAVHIPPPDRDHRSPRPERSHDDRPPGEAGRNHPPLTARPAGGRMADFSQPLPPREAEAEEAETAQRQAIKDCVQGLARADRGQMVMACGTGKSHDSCGVCGDS